ncbi:MAG: rod shape-determining protein MreD [Bacteroidales bacterium]|nr:rod shape-determining protein MreD [Bacteroidales bacterium]MBK9355915.1 rod shape-determining protein MreD [Bacteroidales bacterium]
MNNTYGKDLLRFFLLIALQVLLLDHVNLGGYINPNLYVFFILLLPFEVPGWLLLISSFLIGLGVDLFSNSTGLHAAASVFMAYLRPWVIRKAGAPADYEGNLKPGIADMGFRWFLSYAAILILAHHLILALLDSFRFAEAGMIFIRLIVSSSFTLLLVILSEYLFMRRRK